MMAEGHVPGETAVNDDGNASPRDFPTTCWSLIAQAGSEDRAGPREALAELLQRYLPALRAYLVHRNYMKVEQADDLLQGFVSDNILQRDLLARADHERGKFRTLLLTALQRYAVDQWRAEHAKRRHSGPAVSLDAKGPEHLAREDCTAARFFDVAWARQVLKEALARMQAECSSSDRDHVWGVFEARLVGPILHGHPPMSYDELVKQFHLTTPRKATNVLITGKRMFVRHLRNVVGEYTPEEEIDLEIQKLQRDLSREA